MEESPLNWHWCGNLQCTSLTPVKNYEDFSLISYGLSLDRMDLLPLGQTFLCSLWMTPPIPLVAISSALENCLPISVNQIYIPDWTHWCLSVEQVPIVKETGSSCNHTCDLILWWPYWKSWVAFLSLLPHCHCCCWSSSEVDWVAWAGDEALISPVAWLPCPVMWLSRSWNGTLLVLSHGSSMSDMFCGWQGRGGILKPTSESKSITKWNGSLPLSLMVLYGSVCDVQSWCGWQSGIAGYLTQRRKFDPHSPFIWLKSM